MTPRTLLAAGLLALAAAPAPLARRDTPPPVPRADVARLTELLGLDVRDTRGAPVAQLDDLVFDPTGRLVAVVLRTHPDEPRLALPPDLLRAVPPARDADPLAPQAPAAFHVPLTPAMLADTPRLAVHDDHRRVSLHELERTYAWYERRLHLDAPRSEPVPLLHASQLLEREATNPHGERLGRVSDLVLALARRRVLYAVLQRIEPRTLVEKRFALPVRALTPPGEPADALVLDLPAARLVARTGFGERWPARADTTLLESLPGSPRLRDTLVGDAGGR